MNWKAINWETLTIAYYVVMSISASTTICFKSTRDMAAYGKLTVDRKLSLLYISKSKNFGVMYIIGLITIGSLFYIFIASLWNSSTRNIVAILSYNTLKTQPSSICFECT